MTYSIYIYGRSLQKLRAMSSSLILAGLGMAAVGFGGRYVSRTMPQMAKKAEEVLVIKTTYLCFLSFLGIKTDATTNKYRSLG